MSATCFSPRVAGTKALAATRVGGNSPEPIFDQLISTKILLLTMRAWHSYHSILLCSSKASHYQPHVSFWLCESCRVFAISAHYPLAKLFPLALHDFQCLSLLLLAETAMRYAPLDKLSPSMQSHSSIANHDLVEFVRKSRAVRNSTPVSVSALSACSCSEQRKDTPGLT